MNKSVYGPRVFSILAIVFLTFVLPYTTATAVNLAYLGGGAIRVDHPEDLHAINASNVSGPTTAASWHDYANNLSYKWNYFEDRPETSTLFNEDCAPYDWGNTAAGYPATNYSITNYYGTNLTRTNQFIWADDPFKAPSIYCTTLNDDVGVRIEPAAILGSLRVGQNANKSIGLALTNFEASMVMFRAGISGFNSTLFAEFDWRLEIDGVKMFGENVRSGDEDSYILNEGVFGNNSVFYPQTKFRHVLSINEERGVRDAIAGKNLNDINMTLIFRCHETQTRQPGFPLSHEACEFMQAAAFNGINTDAAFNVQTTWVQADDYDFWIQGSAWILSILMFVMAIASTPLWDPFSKWVSNR